MNGAGEARPATASGPVQAGGDGGVRPRVLVTGGSGFIGSHVLDVLAARGYTPVNFDRVGSPHHQNGSVQTVLGEVTDSDTLERAMAGCEAVIHLAAMADVGDVQKDPEGAERANCRGTIAVLEAARRAGVGRVVYGSTIWVYSDCEEIQVDEDTRLVPPSHLYTATKLAGELYCRSYSELYGIDYTVLRFGIPYGPRARPAAVVPMFVDKALRGDALTVAGTGSQSRRFVYVEDLADGIVRGLRDEARNRVYNLASDETVSILEIAETVKRLVGDVEIVHTPARAGDFGGKEVASRRALEELGWAATTPFSEGVRRYYEWRLATGPAAVPSAEPERTPVHRRVRMAGAALGRALRTRRVRPALSVLAISGAFFWSFATDDSFSLLAMTFRAKPQTSVATTRPDVGLLIEAPPALAPAIAADLHAHNERASFALDTTSTSAALAAIRANGSDAVPQLRSGEFVRWLGTRGEIKRSARRLGISGHVYYAVPRKGFTFGQDLLGHTAGATPIAGAVHVDGNSERGLVRRGDIVEVVVPSDPSQSRALVGRLARQLDGRGLAAVPVDTLLRVAKR